MQQVRGVICDVDGVLLVDGAPAPGADRALRRLREAGLGVVLLTNITSRRAGEVARHLRDRGLDVADDDVVTATMLTGEHLRREHRGARCLVLNAGSGTADLGDVVRVDSDPEVVVVGSPGPGAFTWERLSCAYRAVLDGAPLVAMHRSLGFHTAEGMVLDGGAYVTGLEHATATPATVVGKPSPDAFRRTAERIGLAPEHVAMVGDRLRVDVLPAQEVGMLGVLVDAQRRMDANRLADTVAPDEGLPQRVIESITELPDLLGC